jgi:Ca-activated chloride channel family protein
MKKRVWLGLTAVGGAALVVAATWMIQNGLQTPLPAPADHVSHALVPPPPPEVPLTRVPAEVPTLPAPPPRAAAPVPTPGETAPILVPGEAAQDLGLEAGVPGGVEGGVPGGVVGGVVGGLPSASAELLLRSAPASPGRAVPHGALQMEKRQEFFRAPLPPVDREGYDPVRDNPFLAAATNPLSTFSIDVDTASYANVRRFLTEGRLPPKDAVRIEELVNYFRYEYPAPRGGSPFSITTELGACPWKPEHRLVLVGLRGRAIDDESLPPRNLTFLLDVSGSMRSPDKLPLLKRAMGVLVDSLRAEDRVAIVVYAGSSGLVLPSTSGAEKGAIHAAIDSLWAGGSTAGAAGIRLAYEVAKDRYVEGGINRVILATDGDFNVGVSSDGELVRLIEEKRESGVFLSVLGFGEGNLQDAKMEKLADHGNGNYSYIDSFREARKVLGTEAGGTLVTIAKDVKIQVEFNPARVRAYRLIGYENRTLRAEDFADDRKDAGEIGAGHTVTALYEIVPVGVEIDLPAVDPLKYQSPSVPSGDASSRDLLTVKLRHKAPDGDRSRLQTVAVEDREPGEASANLRFASAVAAFGMLLRDSEYKGAASWSQVIELARGAVGTDPDGYRTEFLVLARNAASLASREEVAVTR